MILEEYYWGMYHSFNMLRLSNFYGDIEVTWRPLAERVFREVFDTQSGRVWWLGAKSHLTTDVVELGDRVLSEAGSVARDS